jgi:hypothetical protein
MKKKLTSRKLWLAIAGLVVGTLALFGVDANTTQQISGVIMSLGSVVAYIVGEGLVDAAAAGASNAANEETKQE